MARFDPFSPSFDHPLVNSSPDFAPRNGSIRQHPVGGTTSKESHVSSFRDRFNHLRAVNDCKNQLIEDLIDQLETTRHELAYLHSLRSQDSYNSQIVKGLEQQLKQVGEIVDRDPYLTILIDGDSAIFKRKLLIEGSNGGKKAAERLRSAMSNFAVQHLPEIQSPKLKLFIYADFTALDKLLANSNAPNKSRSIHEFIKGFNGAESSFHIVDAGTAHGVVESKLIDCLRLDLYNCHCRHILLGLSHKDEYAKILEEINNNHQMSTRITLLGNADTGETQGLLKDDFPSFQVEDVFQTISTLAEPTLKNTAVTTPNLARVGFPSTTGLRTPEASASNTPQMTWAGLAAQTVVASASATTTNRASTPMSDIRAKPPSIKAKTVTRGALERNRLGQRIDKHDQSIPYHEVTRIKKMKLCNMYYLQGQSFCTSLSCTHRHDYPITNFEKKVLREVARMTPCYYKMECEDSDCIYGHRCPQSKPGEDGCYYGDECRFAGWGHGIDTKVVKTTKV